MTKIFFATDIHGSEKCWKKFINAGIFYEASTLILGGDMTGKAIVPVIKEKEGLYRAYFLEQEHQLKTRQELEHLTQAVRDRGYYPVHLDREEISVLENDKMKQEELFKKETLETVRGWIEWAEERLKKTRIPCYVCPGNDDTFEIDELFNQSDYIELAEGKLVQLPLDYQMISTGWSNPTPWKTYRECSEEELESRIRESIDKLDPAKPAVFNIHPPPYGLGLDEAPELDENLRPRYAGRALIPVGSTAVRKLIEEYQPRLALFGHIHEAKGATRCNKNTLCINPGSNYEQGVLMGALINLEKDKIGEFQLTTG
ncbi:MAG: metallophosphoesterase family protein [Bacillota bacterium]